MLADAWDFLIKSNLQRAWNKLWIEELKAGYKIANDNEKAVYRKWQKYAARFRVSNNAMKMIRVSGCNNNSGYRI